MHSYFKYSNKAKLAHVDEKPAVADQVMPFAGRDPVPISKSVIKTVLNKRGPREMFVPALNNTSYGRRIARGVNRVSSLPNNTKLEAPTYDFAEIDKVMSVESMVQRAFGILITNIMPGEDAFRLEGKNPRSVDYIHRRLEELTLSVGHNPWSFVREVVENVVKKSNAVIWLRRFRNPQRQYKYFQRTLNKIQAIEVIDPTMINVMRDTESNRVKGWHISTPGGEFKVNMRDSYHIRYQQISKDHLFGCPFVVPVLDDILALRRIEEISELAIGKATFPIYHLSVGDKDHQPTVYGSEGEDSDIARAKNAFNNMAPEGFLVTPGWYDLNVVQPSNVASFEPFLEWYRDRIFMGLLTDGVSMGLGSTANRNTANTMTQAMMTKVRDIQTVVANQLTRGLIRELLVEGGFAPAGEDAVYFVFKDNDLEGRMLHENHVMAQMQGGMYSSDEARRAVGRDPFDKEYFNSDQSFLAYASRLKKEEEASKQKVMAENRTQPQNQHGRSGTRPRAASRKDSFEFMRNTFLTTADINEQAAKVTLKTQAMRLRKAVLDDLSTSIVVTNDVKATVRRRVDQLIKDILSQVDKGKGRQSFDSLKYRVDSIYDSLVREYQLQEDEDDE